jgi:serine O-acetyltransferase
MWTGVFIHPRAEIGPGFEIHTFYGVFVGITKIGKNCTVGTGVLVTCGVRSIGDNVYIGAGAKLVGDVKIGNNVVIMPNSLIITDVGDNITIAGVPARIKLRGGRPKEFYPAIEQNPKATAKQQASAVARKPSPLQPVEPKTDHSNV